MVNALRAAALPDPSQDGYEADDPNDAWLLALADQAQADWLVTGDKKAGLLVRKRIGRARIATASAFCSSVLGD